MQFRKMLWVGLAAMGAFGRGSSRTRNRWGNRKMKNTMSVRSAIIRSALLYAALGIGSLTAWADDTNQEAVPEPTASPAPAPPSLWPGMAGPLAVNSKPLNYTAGPLGTVYITGVASGFGQWESNILPGDSTWLADVSNAQIMLNKPDGLVQFFAQVGAYSLPAIGVPYIPAEDATLDFYGVFSQGFLKLQLTDAFSIEGGQLPTLIGAEYTFSFENMNVQRGLLWNQENAVNRGVQANYAIGPVVLAAAWNDGFFSGRYTWAWGSAAWAIDSANVVSFIGSGNTAHTNISRTATPLFQNNEQLFNWIYTHTDGPWTIEPYFQYTHVPKIPSTGEDADTYGGALFVNYKCPDDATIGGLPLAGFSVPVRLEFIASTGSVGGGAPNLLYGPGSKAWSITITPTYQYKIFFARPEFSFVDTFDATPGSAFGPNGHAYTQSRMLLEMGVLF